MSRARLVRTTSLLMAGVAALGIAAGIALAAPAPAPASSPSPLDPISIEAERLDVDVATGAAVLEGNVVLRRGELTVMCVRAEARIDREARIVWAKGEGPVVATFRDVRAEAKELELDAPRQRLELRGGVRVHRPGADVTAQTAVIEGPGGKIQLTGVKAVLSSAPASALSSLLPSNVSSGFPSVFSPGVSTSVSAPAASTP